MSCGDVCLLLAAGALAAATPTGIAGGAGRLPVAHESEFEYRCTTNDDCERLGECVSGSCVCHPGFTGPSCAQLAFVPPDEVISAWPPSSVAAGDRGLAYGWGFSVAADRTGASTVLHAVGNVGCYGNGDGPQVTNTFLLHLTATDPEGPWTPAGIVAPTTTFNPHLRIGASGEAILFFRGTSPAAPANWTDQVCSGVPAADWKRLVAAGPYITPDQITDPIGNFVSHASTMSGPWTTRPFEIVGQPATCTNRSVIGHNSNPSAVILSSGVVVLAYRYTFTSGSESVNIAVAQNVSGPFEAMWPCNYSLTGTWGEDPFVWQAPDGTLHMLYHCMRYGHGVPNSPGLHAWSANRNGDGRDEWHATTSPGHRGAYPTNIALANGSSTGLRFNRRERPDILFDVSGQPIAFYSALQQTTPPPGGKWGWSFSYGQRLQSK